MTPLELLLQLSQRSEGPTLDFKRTHYLREPKVKQYEFVKDIIAMANTRREGPAYIVLGIDYTPEIGATYAPLDQQVEVLTL